MVDGANDVFIESERYKSSKIGHYQAGFLPDTINSANGEPIMPKASAKESVSSCQNRILTTSIQIQYNK